MSAHSEPGAGNPAEALPVLPTGQGFNLLSGVRIIDLTTSIAGPSATMLLADMGAEVLKIEKPNGSDDARSWGPPFLDDESLWFLSINRNKKSVALDYSQPEGLDILYRLVSCTDIVVASFPPRVARKLKVDAETLRHLCPSLIYVSITGFGLSGERSDWTCYDLIAEGYSGIMDLTGDAGGEPQKIGAPAADMLAGQDAAFSTVAALYARQQTGVGHVIDVALVDSMTRFLCYRIVPYLGSGEVPTRSGGKDGVIAMYQTFETADLPITLGLGSDNLWQRFWTAIGRPEMVDMPGMMTNAQRRSKRQRIVAMISDILRKEPQDYWLTLLHEARVPAGPINSVAQVVCDGALIDRRMFYHSETARGRLVPQVGTGIVIDGRSNVPRAMAPRLGEHTESVLRGLLGVDEPQLKKLDEKCITGRMRL